MISAKCKQCGLINDLAAEICRRCGAELESAADSFDPQGLDLEISPAIGPFLGIGDVLSPTINLFKNNLWLITKIIFVIFAPYEILKALSVGQNVINFRVVTGIFLLDLFCKALVAPALIYALMTVLRTGVAPSLNDSYRLGLSKLWRLITCTLLAGVAELLGFACLIIPGIILAISFSLIYPITALENLGPVDTLTRSYRLTKGHRWNIFAASFVIGLLTILASIPVGVASAILLQGGVDFWPVKVGLALGNDIVSESTTILSLVIYLSLLALKPADVSPVIES